jgi:hypothetical protein
MPTQRRAAIPPGYVIVEYPDRTYEARTEYSPTFHSQRYARRYTALQWIYRFNMLMKESDYAESASSRE